MIPLTADEGNLRMLIGRRLVPCAATVLAALLLRGELVSAEPTPAPESTAACTIEAQQRSGEECLMCGVMQGDPAKCLKRLAGRGYTRRCRGEGTAQWLELWCRPGQPAGGVPSPK
jgi:hypothetical protein